MSSLAMAQGQQLFKLRTSLTKVSLPLILGLTEITPTSTFSVSPQAVPECQLPQEAIDQKLDKLQMNGREVFKLGCTTHARSCSTRAS